jgi:hypothetical protein
MFVKKTKDDAKYISELENKIHVDIKNFKYKTDLYFKGNGECYMKNNIILEKIKNY